MRALQAGNLVSPPWLDASGIAIPSVDVVVSFVLHDAPAGEADQAISQVLQSGLRSHVVVVDNSALPQALDHGGDPRVTVVRPPLNLGYGCGHNVAIALSRGCSPLHLVANTDLSFPRHAMRVLFDVMKAYPAVGLAAPQMLYPDGRRQHNARLLPTPWDLVAKRVPWKSAAMRKRCERFLLTHWNCACHAELPFLTGCFMLFRRPVLEQVDGFDPRFFVFGEDVDLSRRAHRVARTLFVPEVEVTHLSRTESSPSWRRTALLVAGYIRYFNKWGWIRDVERDAINRRVLEQLGLAATEKPLSA